MTAKATKSYIVLRNSAQKTFIKIFDNFEPF